MSYPVLYESNATDFFSNGLGTLPDAITATVTEERNGEFVFDVTYPSHGRRAGQIKNNRIIKVDAGHLLKDQRFVVKTVTPTMDNSGKTIIAVHAEHVSYKSNDFAIKPQLSISDMTAEQALNFWNENLTTPNQFTVDSDINTHNSTSWSIDKVQSARQALGGVEGSILDVWGGEYRFDNLHISLLSKRGTVSNTLLAYGRNITSFEQEQNIINTYTSIYPYFISSDNTNSDPTIYTIDGLTVNAPNADKFPNQKVLPLNMANYLGDIKIGSKPSDNSADDKTEYISVSELKSRMKSQAQKYIKDNDIGIPKVSIKVSFIDLSKTSNYVDVAPLEELDLCDNVPIRFPDLDIDTTAKVSRVIWNVLTDSYDSLELGDISATLGEAIAEIDHKANEAQKSADKANTMQIGADGKSTVFRGPNTPTANHIGDLWYKPNGQDTEMYQWDGVTWAFVISTKDTHEISDKVEKAQEEAAEAKQRARDAVNTANQAIADAGFATDTADTAKQIAEDTKKDVVTANSDSATALDNAKTALNKANQAVNDVASGKTDISNIQDKVNTINSSLSGVSDDLNTAKADLKKFSDTAVKNGKDIVSINKDVSSIKIDSANTKGNVSQLQQTATKLSSDITDAQGNISRLQQKADSISSTVGTLKTGLDGTNKTVKSQGTQITQNATALKSKANKTDVDAVTNRVTTAETNISQNTEDIESKADSTTVNALSGEVSQNTSDIKQNAKGITSKVSSSDVQGMLDNGGYATQSWTGSQIKQSADEINSTVTSVSNKVDNFQVGGRNLLKNTDFLINSDAVRLGNSVTYVEASQLANRKATLSVGINVDEVTSVSGDARIYVNLTCYQGSNKLETFNALKTFKVRDIFHGRVSSSFTLPEGTDRFGSSNVVIDGVAGLGLTVGRPKLELGNKATDWTPAPEDMATVTALSSVDQKADSISSTVTNNKSDTDTKFTNINQTIHGIQSTVKNKADSSTVTQLSNVVDSKVSMSDYNSEITQLADDINLAVKRTEAEGTNLIRNGSFKNGESWQIDSSLTTWFSPSGGIPIASGTYMGFSSPTDSSQELSIIQNPSQAIMDSLENNTVTLSCYTRSNENGGRFRIYFKVTDSKGDSSYYGINDIHDLPTGWTRYSTTATLPSDIEEVNLTYMWLNIPPDVSCYITGTMLTMGDQLLPYQDSNLDVVNQINLDKSGVLIQGKKIMIDGDTYIKNGVIKSAMIDTLDANKITTGTLNAANVNVVNLNASNITTGTLNANLISMRATASGKSIKMDGNGISGWDANGRLRMKWGIQDLAGDGQSDPSNLILYTGNGNKSFSIGTNTDDTLVIGTESKNMSALIRSGLRITLNTTDLRIYSPSSDRNYWKINYTDGEPEINTTVPVSGRIGSSSNYISAMYGYAGNFRQLDVGFGKGAPQEGDLRVGKDSTSALVLSRAIRNRTYSNSPNMVVTSYGVLGRSTSASKYKLDISDVDNLTEKAQSFLAVKPKQWFDKQETQDFANKLMGNDMIQESPTVNHHAGFIAEDLAVAGLTEFISYGADGSLEGIQYDRLPILHHELLRQAYNKIDYLMTQLNIMDKRISELEGDD
ncbi:phage tail spike protein [Ligilactobacillus acidipiscis]|uniref:Phage protein n=1 Tax=Ligilactobacillus acidipiscis TaxID=89059 RepID=A0A0R2KLQ0_9LACO|nr:phage tail spike protein [Ligilactobacillus acidipiscis]KRN88204.1 phage protein [Ligilactobacillus acidipiscis]